MSNLGLWACSLIYGNETVRFSNDDLETCLRGRSQLEKENTRIIKTLLEFQTDDVLQSVNCNTWERCHKAVALLVLTAAEGGLLNDASPLSCWDQWRDDMYIKDGNLKPCDLCDKALRRTIDDRREEVWQKLGKIFGVEPWPVVDAHHHEVVSPQASRPHHNSLYLYLAKSHSRNLLLAIESRSPSFCKMSAVTALCMIITRLFV